MGGINAVGLIEGIEVHGDEVVLAVLTTPWMGLPLLSIATETAEKMMEILSSQQSHRRVPVQPNFFSGGGRLTYSVGVARSQKAKWGGDVDS